MYQVIARKYRPQTFEQVVNQRHVLQTLENALTQGRVAHGYIFAGQRGTGKTTVARILAKCLNCHRTPGPQPCLECASCREIAAGNSLDVIEIDAASNRGIDDVRELRENVRYRPSRDRYKAFIIDEAHQITDAAFNALLKTLEEPPEWVVFLLCTTEAQKIPSTIASRCQNFTFQMVEFSQVSEHLRRLCEQEGIEAEADALSMIALAGDGSIRDSLSTLDQAIASCGKTLRAADLRQLLGVVASEALDTVTQALLDQSPGRMLELVDQITGQGQNPQHFCRDLVRYFRNLLVARTVGAESRLIAATGEERRRLNDFAPRFSEEDLTRYLQLVLNLFRDLQHAPHARFHLEMGLVKLVQAGRLMPLEQALAGTAAPAAPSGRSSTPPARTAGPPPRPVAAPLSAPAEPAVAAAAATGDLQGRLVVELRSQGDAFTADAVEHSRVQVSGAEVLFAAPADQQFCLESALPALTQLCEQLLAKRIKARVTLAEPGDSERNGASQQAASSARTHDAAAARALADPQVQRFLTAFGGQVREVRDWKEKQT
jgi:DNA polymerase-3 subunit gamma/tau